MSSDAGRANACADHVVARALADAFLGAPVWDLARLVDHGALVLGARRRWLGPVAREVLASFRAPPRDEPRVLTGLIASSARFHSAADAARSAGRPLRVVAWHPSPTAMGVPRWPVALLPDLAALGDLLGVDQGRLAWLADTAQRQRRAPSGALHLHRYRWVARAGRAPRLLEVPLPGLRRAQRRVLDEILSLAPAHGAAHGFVPGRSAVTGARRHTGSAVVIGLDLVAFFASVRASRVYGILRTAGYPQDVAYALTGLCTTATPVAVIAAMPPGGSPEQRAQLRRRLADTHLAQGAPSSPQLANLVAHRLDVRLDGYAQALGATYTRYADDLTFSGAEPVRRRAQALVRGVTRIVTGEGFTLNQTKTRVQHRGARQRVTGIVVNEHTSVCRADVDRLKATLHNAVRTGPQAQNRDGVADFRAHLTGRVAWVEQLDPGRGRRLRAELDRIVWPRT